MTKQLKANLSATPKIISDDELDKTTKLLLNEDELAFVQQQIDAGKIHKKLRRKTKDSVSPLSHSVIFDSTGKPYILYKLLGQGYFGTVKIAQSLDGKWHAIKIQKITASLHINQTEHENELLHELGLLTGTLSLLSCSRKEDTYMKKHSISSYKKNYSIITYEHGTTLSERLIDKKNTIIKMHHISLKEKLLIATKLMAEMHKLHQKKIIHRDLKLDNVMWDGTHLKIIDFGLGVKLAQHKSQDIIISNAVGTIDYTAPEISNDPSRELVTPEGGSVYSFASDIFAAGELLRKLFIVHSKSDILNPSLKDKIKNFIFQMKSFDPTSRPDSISSQLFFKEHLIEHVSFTEEPRKLNWQIEILRYQLEQFIEKKELEIINDKKSKIPNILHFLRIDKQQEINIAQDVVKNINILTKNLDLETDLLEPKDLISFYSHLMLKCVQNKALHTEVFRFSSGTIGSLLSSSIKIIRESIIADMQQDKQSVLTKNQHH